MTQWDGNAWQGLAGSDQRGGISNSATSSQRPSLTIKSWVSPWWPGWKRATSSWHSSTRPPTADKARGLHLGNSMTAGGISGTGAADHPRIVNTATGPAVAWLNRKARTTEIRVQRFNGSAWVAVGTTVVASASDCRTCPTCPTRPTAPSWPLPGHNRWPACRVSTRWNSPGTSWQELAGSASGNGISTSPLAADQPTLAYHAGELHVAWRQHVRPESNETEIYAARLNMGRLAAGRHVGDRRHGIAATTRDRRRKTASGLGRGHLASDRGTRTTIYAKQWNGTAFVERYSCRGTWRAALRATAMGCKRWRCR